MEIYETIMNEDDDKSKMPYFVRFSSKITSSIIILFTENYNIFIHRIIINRSTDTWFETVFFIII